MKAKLEGQQEVVTQVSHMLHSPIAALDYQMRLLNPEEPCVAPIQVCMRLIMEISSQFPVTQCPELCAHKSSAEFKPQHSGSEACQAGSKHAQVPKKADAVNQGRVVATWNSCWSTMCNA